MVGPWDISIRTDPEGQNVYGPSLATVEDVVLEPCQSGGTSTKHVTSLGMSKASHEFLTLHYFALDSAEWWKRILGALLPNAQFPDAVVRRTIAYKMFTAVSLLCPFFFSVAALLSTVAVKLLLEVKKRSKFSSPTENNTKKPNNTNKPRQG